MSFDWRYTLDTQLRMHRCHQLDAQMKVDAWAKSTDRRGRCELHVRGLYTRSRQKHDWLDPSLQ